VAFFAWGVVCAAARPGSPGGRGSGAALWGGVAAAALLVLGVQACVQLLFALGNDAWASDPRTQRILELLGCPKAQGGADLFLARNILFAPMT
jgi:hypothetical protein